MSCGAKRLQQWYWLLLLLMLRVFENWLRQRHRQQQQMQCNFNFTISFYSIVSERPGVARKFTRNHISPHSKFSVNSIRSIGACDAIMWACDAISIDRNASATAEEMHLRVCWLLLSLGKRDFRFFLVGSDKSNGKTRTLKGRRRQWRLKMQFLSTIRKNYDLAQTNRPFTVRFGSAAHSRSHFYVSRMNSNFICAAGMDDRRTWICDIPHLPTFD